MRSSKVYLPASKADESKSEAAVKPAFVPKAARFAAMAPGVRFKPAVTAIAEKV